MKKVKEIEEISKKSLRLQNIIEYSLYSTYRFEELIFLLKENYLNIYIRDRILTQLKKNHLDKDFKEFFEYLIPLYSNGNGNIKRIIGKIFTILDSCLLVTHRKQIYRISVFSHMPSIRKKAYEQVPYLYKEEDLFDDLITNWEKYHDISVLYILLKYKRYEFLFNNFLELWNDENITKGLKHKIVNELAENNPNIIPIVKKLDKISYLSACYYAKDLSFLPLLEDIISSSETIDQLSYCIWILGQLGLYNEINNLIPLINKIEKKLPKNMLELEHERFYGAFYE